MSSLPFPPSVHSPLAKNAPAPLQFSRLLDALLLLDAQGSCRVSDLAHQVGLEPGRMRELLSTFMVAGADVLGPEAPFNLDFGTAEGALDGSLDDDDAQAGAEVVRLSSLRGTGQWLLDDVGRRPVMVRDVARVLLAARLLLEGGLLPDEQQAGVRVLAKKLSDAMRASVAAPAGTDAAVLHRAVQDRQRVRFRYLHPWKGDSEIVETQPYDVRRRRDRLVLDAGDPLATYDVGGMSELQTVGPPASFEPPLLPDAEGRLPSVDVVLRVPAYSQEERWLLDGWAGLVDGPVGDGDVEVRISLDGDSADAGVVQRLGVLLLQLGPTARIVSPEDLRSAASSVGQRLMDAHAD